MHLILALGVIILQHVNSYSCRSILRALDDFNSKSIEDSSESYELRNEEIMELLQPFLELKPEEVSKEQQAQKNFAKLTIEPYFKSNRTRKGQRKPFSSLNKRKTLAPLAIILTNLPDLKPKHAGDKNKEEKSLSEKVNENNLYVHSEDVLDKIQYLFMKDDEQKQITDEIKDLDINKVEYVDPKIESNKEKPHRNILDNDKTLKPVISKTIEVTTKSPDPVSIEEKDLNNPENNKKYEDQTDVKTELQAITWQLANKGILNESAKPIEDVENLKDNYASDDYTLYPIDLENKDVSDSAEDKLQNVLVEVSETQDALAQNNQLMRELNREDLEYAGDTEEEKLRDEENYELITSSFEITKASPDIVGQTLEIGNRDRIIQEPNKPLSKEDEKHLYTLQNNIDLEDEQLNTEYAKEISQSHPKYLNIVLKENEDPSKQYTEENPLTSLQNHQYNIQEYLHGETDEELSNEDGKEEFIKDYQKHLHSLHEMHESHENWHHDMDDGPSWNTHKIFNLYFHFER